MNIKLFLGGLPFSMDDKALTADMATLGVQAHSVRIIMDRETGASRGFGFVEVDADRADEALGILDGATIGGRRIRAERAQQQQRTSGRGPRGGSAGSDDWGDEDRRRQRR